MNDAFPDVAHLGHVELFTPDFEKSLWFFTDLLAMREVAREGDSAYLHAWGDEGGRTIKLTAAETSGVGRVALRAASEEALQRRVAAIEAAGHGVGWHDGEPGIGPTYSFTDPHGHPMDIYYKTQWQVPAEESSSLSKGQPARISGHGLNTGQRDQGNLLAVGVADDGRITAPENMASTRENSPGWVVAMCVGVLVGLTSAGMIGIFLSNMNTRCSLLSADSSLASSPDPLRLEEALTFYCSSVSPGPDIAWWASILGLIIGAAMAIVIGVRGRHEVDDADRDA